MSRSNARSPAGPREYIKPYSASSSSSSSSTQKHSKVAPAPEDLPEREDSDLGFAGALFVNGALSAGRATLQAVTDEITFAIDQIPRYPYPDPFAVAPQGRRRQKRKDDEDDE